MDILSFVKRLLLYGVACLVVIDPPAARGGDRFAGMDPYIREAMEKWEVPGLAIAVVKDGETVLARGYGVCELGKDRKVSANTVLGEVVTHVSGQPWEQFVAERIFRPRNMKSTTSSVTEVPPDRLALRHWRSDAGIVARPAPPAGGGIYSTVGDMAHWLKLQLAEGTYGDRRFLKRETVREMHALQFSVPTKLRPTDNIYAAHFYGSGLGWFVQDYRGRKVVLHGGSWGGRWWR